MAKDPAYAEAVLASQKSADRLVARITALIADGLGCQLGVLILPYRHRKLTLTNKKYLILADLNVRLFGNTAGYWAFCCRTFGLQR